MSYQRIVSLVPSLTELVADLGFSEALAGRTRFCIHPEEATKKVPIVGGTKNPDIEKIKALQPDLVIANKEENRKEDVDALRGICEVVVTEISTIEDALLWIEKLGRKLEVSQAAEALVKQIRKHIHDTENTDPVRTAYFIWKDPWMTIGGDTYIHDVLRTFGLLNVFGDEERYPKTDMEDLKAREPELILLSSEPFPFKEKHIEEISGHFPDADIRLIDGEWFSWYGSRMLPSFKALSTWRKSFKTSP